MGADALMRVVHVDPERAWGGGEVQVLGLCVRQVEQGIDVRLAANPTGRLAREAEARGLSVVPLAVRNHLDVRAGWRLRQLVRGADVVHFHTARAHALAPWAGGLGVRRVVTRRMDYVPRGLAVGWLYGRAVDVVIAISEGVRRALVAGGVSAERIVVVPSGVDLDRVRAQPDARERMRELLDVGDETTLVLGLGALERRKGFDVLIEAVAKCGEDVQVVLAGAGSERAALESLAGARAVRLRCVGFQEDVAPYLAAADVVAIPSRAEGLGIAALEAMAAGRAVVASRVGGLGEVVEHERSGLLVASEAVDELRRAIMRLVRDRGLREALGAAASARVREVYSLDAMAAGTRACYEHAP